MHDSRQATVTAHLVTVCFLALAGFGAAQPAPSNPSVLDELMPRPVKVETAATGETPVVPAAALANVTVVRETVPGAPAATADEAYILEIGSNGAKITAQSPFGECWARVTLDQIVRLSGGGEGGHAGRVPLPCCRIVDWPRLKWRGFMLDSVRNYLPPQGVKDVIDMMSRYKLNLFHWHLTENYAWRLESKRFPELQSERAFLHRHKGKFYTQEEFREIVDYAYARGVRVMPEFDFPGHALAFRRAFGFKTMSDPGVAEKAAALFEELCALAPREKMPFIHMGTDEVFRRDVEGAPRETLERMAKAIADGGRTMVSWVPGETYNSPGPRINMLWTDKVSPEKNPGAYFDAIGMYIEDFDPFELLSVAVYHKAARWHDAGDLNQGAIFCAWHDGFVGLPYENLLRNQPVFPSCVLFGNAYWRGRDSDLPQFRKRLPRGGDPLLAEAADVERRVVAQRDRALRDLKHPFHFLRQTDMRWRLTQADGTLIATDIAQATISPGREGCGASNGTVVAETWIKSPKEQTVGAWIGFTNISRDHGLVYSAPLPDVGEWNRFGASVELNGEKIAPPKWKRPGLKKGNPIADWTPAWTLWEADEEPFTDQEYVMREPTPIHLRKGWNHVKLTLPNPSAKEKTRHRWVGTFIPVAGTTDHPHEVPDLEYAANPPAVDECVANLFSRIVCDVGALPPERKFVAELLSDRIEARTVPSDKARTLTVRFVLDAAVPDGNAMVKVAGGRADISAARFLGLVHGAGLLLRRIRYGADSFRIDDGTYVFAPKKGLRMAYFARHFHNWYHHASAKELTEYIDDLALSGHNAFKFQYGYPTADRAADTESDKRLFADISAKALARVKALDCGFCGSGGNNQAPLDSPEALRGVPNSDPKRGNLGFNVCPAKPGGMEYLCEYRKRQLKEMAGGNVDYFIYWPFDEGGCECEQCKPWGGNGFLRLIERYEALNKAAAPGAKTIISTWVFHDDDWAGLYKWLETHDGADYILADSHTDFPKYPLEHRVPKNIPVITFPEISMWGRSPWGGYGAIAMPRRFERLFRQAERISGGFMCYSEGLYEDVNKEVVNGLYIDPSASVGDLLRSYAEYYLPGADPEDFVKLCDIFEANHRFPGNHSRPRFENVPEGDAELAAYRQRADDACRIVLRMNHRMFQPFSQSWRWRLLFLRAMIDREILASREAAPESARPYFDELVKIYHAERQLKDWRRTGKAGYTAPHYPAPKSASSGVRAPCVLTERVTADMFSPWSRAAGRVSYAILLP